MQEQTEAPLQLNDLLTHLDIPQSIIDKLPLQKVGIFASVCRRTKELSLKHNLMRHVVFGKINEAEQILTKHPEFLTHTIEATDYSKRRFDATPFEYALWALDHDMLQMMIRVLTTTESPQENIIENLKAQYDKIQTMGIQYHIEDQTFVEMHYDYSRLIEALDTFENHRNAKDWSDEKLHDYWIKDIGSIQRTLPVDGVDVYLHGLGVEDDEPSERCLEFSNAIDQFLHRGKHWYPLNDNNNLGKTFGILASYPISEFAGVAAQAKIASDLTRGGDQQGAVRDRNLMSNLLLTRLAQRFAVRSELEKLTTSESHTPRSLSGA